MLLNTLIKRHVSFEQVCSPEECSGGLYEGGFLETIFEKPVRGALSFWCTNAQRNPWVWFVSGCHGEHDRFRLS
jgi:hypothetical protein